MRFLRPVTGSRILRAVAGFRYLRPLGTAMPDPLIKTGYDFDQTFTVELDGGLDDGAGATFFACLKDVTKRLELITDTAVTVVDATTSTIRVQFSVAQTANLSAWLSVPQSPLWQASVIPGQPVFIEVARVLGGKRLPIADCQARVEYGFCTG